MALAPANGSTNAEIAPTMPTGGAGNACSDSSGRIVNQARHRRHRSWLVPCYVPRVYFLEHYTAVFFAVRTIIFKTPLGSIWPAIEEVRAPSAKKGPGHKGMTGAQLLCFSPRRHIDTGGNNTNQARSPNLCSPSRDRSRGGSRHESRLHESPLHESRHRAPRRKSGQAQR
jgi:hypothetical protein